jgi:hypothetical protein
VVHLLDEFQEFEIFTRRRPPTLSTTFNNESAPCGIRCRELSMISAITSRGHLRFVILEDGSVNADAFIEFIKRLLVGVKRKIFLIVDGGPAHRAKKTKAFVESFAGKTAVILSSSLFAEQKSRRLGVEARESRHRGAHDDHQ